MPNPSPIRPTDDDARALARSLLQSAHFAALGVLTEAGTPFVSRIAFGLAPDGATPISLVSSLAAHTGALRSNPSCALMIGEPGSKGDPLTHPRLTLEARAQFVDDKQSLRDPWLATHPKARLYIDFADFTFLRFTITAAHLNGGFGKAFRLTPADLDV